MALALHMAAQGDSWLVAVSLIAKRSPARERIYAVLLGAPKAAWTVHALWNEVAGRGDGVSVEAIRPNLYLLLHARLVDEVPHQRVWTVQLTQSGAERLTGILRSWRVSGSAPNGVRLS